MDPGGLFKFVGIRGAFGSIMLLGLFGLGEAVGFKGLAGVGVGSGEAKSDGGLAKGPGIKSGGTLRGLGVLLFVAEGVGVGEAVVVEPPPPPPPPEAQLVVLKVFNKP